MKARSYAGLTKRELASQFGLSEKMIQGWEKVRYKPANKHSQKIVSLLNMLVHNGIETKNTDR